MSFTRGFIITVVLSLVAAVLGALGGAHYSFNRDHHTSSLHDLVHEKLELTEEQQRQIAGMEREHATRRKAIEAEMHAANIELAQALQAQHAYTAPVQSAIERIHRALGELQKESIVHVLAMRSVLTVDQAALFDETVVRALTQDPE
jgi:uncharacterized membrane protein